MHNKPKRNHIEKKPNFTFDSSLWANWLMVLFLFISACKEEEPSITEVNFEEQEFAPFVESDFPYITTSMDARNLGAGFPEDNISARVLALRLGNDAYACFDPDLLRWTVAWTGDFLPMVTMAQISYKDFYNKDNKMPRIGGEPKIATGSYPGWFVGEPTYNDPRPANPYPNAPSWGPMPVEFGRWSGSYIVDNKAILSYTIDEVEINELPGSLSIGGEIGFTRVLAIGPAQSQLSVVAAEVADGVKTEFEDDIVYVHNGEGKITAVGVSGDREGMKVAVKDNRYVSVSIDESQNRREVVLVLWQGEASGLESFRKMVHQAAPVLPNFKKGGPAHWDETVLTKGQLSPDTAAFVTDMLTLPIPNPWKRNVRVVDLSFFDGKKAAVVTFEGDVWIVEGINDKLNRLKWRRYASGLYEPQSIIVKDGQIYVYGKEGIVRFHDLNGDGVADYYENFSNIIAQSIETREWASDMVAAPDGGFYVAKFGALDMGPEASSPRSIMGFRAGSQHGGSILRISEDGKSIETYATGFRGPYLGIDPRTGMVSASDQQGNYMPSTPVMLVRKGDYYGVPATAHRDPIPDITPSMVWIPHAEDRSGVSQVWVHSEKMGPLNGQMLHLSYGRPGLFVVKVDSANSVLQGGVSVLEGHYPAPTMKAQVNPTDGQVYIAGFSLWGHNSNTLSALIRLRYTGKESFMPSDYHVRDGGIVIRFEQELDEATAAQSERYLVKRWNYQRTEKYGSGHFNLDGSVGEEPMPVLDARLSDDKKAVFLSVPNIAEVMQMEVRYDIVSKSGRPMKDVFWFTVNQVTTPDFLADGFSSIDAGDLVYDYDTSLVELETQQKPTPENGKEIFMKMGCNACHAVDGNSDGKLGTDLQGIYGTERQFVDGTSAIVDEAYLTESIVEPSKRIVKGYDEGMPSFLGILSENDIQSIVLFIRDLK